MIRSNPFAVAAVAAVCPVAAAGISTYTGVNSTYWDARNAFLDDFMALTGETVGVETFEGLNASMPVGDMPGNDGRFAAENADGSAAPLPIIQVTPAAAFGNQWVQNFGNGRPFGSSWVIRPDNPGDLIYAFAQTNAQGDWVRVLGYDANDQLVVSVDASNAGTAFAGFISDVGLSRVVVTPLGNGDFANGMDDVFVSVTAVPAPGAVAALGGALAFATRRRR